MLTEMEQNWIIFTPYGIIKNLRQIHSKNRHVEFAGYVAWLVKNSETVFSKLVPQLLWLEMALFSKKALHNIEKHS